MQSKKAYGWISSLYFFQSLPFVMVTVMGTIIYQQYGLDNTLIVFITSMLTLPWVIKPLFAPYLEQIWTKKKLTILAQWLIFFILFSLALCANKSFFLPMCIISFACLAFISSIHDIVADGLYLLNLDSQSQKRYVGLRTFAFQMGPFVVKGGLLVLATLVAAHYACTLWQVFFSGVSLITLILLFYNQHYLPERESRHSNTKDSYRLIFKQLLQKPFLYPLLFIFLYNAAEAQMQKILPLFLLDKVGLHLDLATMGSLYGVFGSCFLMAGVFLASVVLTRCSLKQSLWIATPLLALSHAGYAMLLMHQATLFSWYILLCLNQFLVGFAQGVYMGYLLTCANKSSYPMSMSTLCTGIMALSYLSFGSVSGLVEHYLGYLNFFIYIFMMNGLLLLYTAYFLSRQNNADV